MTPLPFGVTLCRLMVDLAALAVPPELRQQWTREWHGRIWHQWQFLHQLDSWGKRESWQLFQRCLLAFPESFSFWWARDDVQAFQRKWLLSPLAPFIGIAGHLVLIGMISGGYPATRQLFTAKSDANSRELLVLLHPTAGGPNKPIPSDAIAAWAQGSHTLESVAPFLITRYHAISPALKNLQPLVIRTNANLFALLAVHPAAGTFPAQAAGLSLLDAADLIIDYHTAEAISQQSGKVIGSQLLVGKAWHRIAAVLPRNFHFLTRQPIAFLCEPVFTEPAAFVVARARHGVTKISVDRELTHIAEDKTYYFFASQLRLQFQRDAILLPLPFFGFAVLSSGLLALAVCGFRMRGNKRNWTGQQSKWALRRVVYFVAKTSLALLLVFVTALEWSRSSSAILFASRDPANGPFLLWLFIAGTMAVFFWSVADGRVRCRTCLRRLTSPVRVGSPGSLLLDWSGTELICTEGHGVLHIPHMTTSWESDSEHWITMDESWRELFTTDKRA